MEKQIVGWHEYDRQLPDVTVNGHTYRPGKIDLRVTGVDSLGKITFVRDELRLAVNEIGGAFSFRDLEDGGVVTAEIALANRDLIPYLKERGWIE